MGEREGREGGGRRQGARLNAEQLLLFWNGTCSERETRSGEAVCEIVRGKGQGEGCI